MYKQVNNYSMAVDVRGEGVPVLFVHGFPLDRKLWKPQLNGLSDLFQVIVPDLRGHGASEAPPPPYSMEVFANDLNSLLVRLGIKEKVVLCGLSMGGYICFEFYRQYPQRIAGLVLTATRSAADSAETRKQRDHAAAIAASQGINAVVEGMLPKLFSELNYQQKPDLVQFVKEMMLNISLQGLLGSLAAMRDRPDSSPLLDKINFPVLVIHGEKDQIVPVQEAEKMARTIPGADLEVFTDSGHLPNLEQPVLYNHYMHKFLLELNS